jgi:hypothetical protein
MKIKTYRVFLWLLMLVLTSLACATLSGGVPTPVPLTIPTVIIPTVDVPSVEIPTVTVPDVVSPTPAGDPPSGNPSGADTLNLDDPAFFAAPAEVNSYRLTMDYTFSGQAADGAAVNGSIHGEGAYSANPEQMSFTFVSTNADVPADTIAIVQMDNTFYMTSPDLGCFSLPADEAETTNPYEELLDTGGFLTGQATRLQPDETINGIPVYVYEITSDNLDTSDPTTQEVTEITFGRLYLAQDGGYIVRLILDGRGQNTVASEESDLIGDVHYEINYLDYNQPVNITVPEGCAGAGDSGGGTPSGSFPVPEGATDQVSMPGFVSFSSTQSPEDLAEFYKSEMVAAGWTMGETFSVTGLVTLSFTKDGKTATVTITADPSSGNTLVLIVEG